MEPDKCPLLANVLSTPDISRLDANERDY